MGDKSSAVALFALERASLFEQADCHGQARCVGRRVSLFPLRGEAVLTPPADTGLFVNFRTIFGNFYGEEFHKYCRE